MSDSEKKLIDMVEQDIHEEQSQQSSLIEKIMETEKQKEFEDYQKTDEGKYEMHKQGIKKAKK